MSPVAGGGLVFIRRAAELSGLHPQTIRLYEEAGLVRPGRSSGGTRLYRVQDIDRLKKVSALSQELGLNLRGIAIIFALEERLARSQAEQERERVSARRREVLLNQENEKLRRLVFGGPLLPVKSALGRPNQAKRRRKP